MTEKLRRCLYRVKVWDLLEEKVVALDMAFDEKVVKTLYLDEQIIFVICRTVFP